MIWDVAKADGLWRSIGLVRGRGRLAKADLTVFGTRTDAVISGISPGLIVDDQVGNVMKGTMGEWS